MEGKEIAVWVYSNLDKVELFLNGESLGSKDVKKDSHLAWIVPYTPGTIEARGSKGGQVAMTAKRETTTAAAKLVMKQDRQELSADGDDVAMFSVEVQDALGRVLPVTDNVIHFRVSDAGRLIGVGNGDPTDHEPDKGSVRKAFCGYAMAIVQSTKNAGRITVKAWSPSLAPASLTIASRGKAQRPQVAVWNREVPKGAGVTGLWRPLPTAGAASGGGAMIFTLRQEGGTLTGNMEGAAGGFFGGSDAGVPLTEGTVDGKNVSFKISNNVYAGTIAGDRIELQRKGEPGPGSGSVPAIPTPGSRPAVGPPPDGSDPSRSPNTRPPNTPP